MTVHDGREVSDFELLITMVTCKEQWAQASLINKAICGQTAPKLALVLPKKRSHNIIHLVGVATALISALLNKLR